jgi:hypothetical protein
MDLSTTAEAIDKQLRAAHPGYPAATVLERDAGLDKRIASGVALLLGGEIVLYVSVDQSRALEHSLVELAVYTPTRLIRAIVSHGYLTLRTMSRSAVTVVEVTSSPDYLADPVDERFTAVASYDEQLNVSLPGDDEASEENLEQLRAFLPSLLGDV